ncbi:hypothetical protein ACX3O0_05045 [Homoserinimonas sp. A447]
MATNATTQSSTPTSPHLRISLSGIARLARVQRPVVSMWRTRSAASDAPFPAPIATDLGQERFDALAIADWLVATGRGNNPDPVADAAVFARLDTATPGDTRAFDTTTSLIALRSANDGVLGSLDRAALLDLAERVDPDDSFLLSELEAQDDLEPFARFVDVLVDGAYGPAAAFESVMAERFRDGRRELTRSALAPAASALVQSAALELARTNPAADPDSPVFADPTGAGADLVVGIAGEAPEHLDVTMLTSDTGPTDAGGSTARLLRRRLLAHGIARAGLSVQSDEPDEHGPVVYIVQLPAEGSSNDDEVLATIDNLALQMDDQQRALVLAPASVLCDGGLSDSASTLRSDVIRTGRVRAIVRLPRGLVTANPRQSLALWVLGPSHRQIALAERWTMLADLTEANLTPDVQHDLVSDVIAAMGDRSAVRAHAFRFARFTLTSGLLARSGSILGEAGALNAVVSARQADAHGLATRVDALIAALAEGTPLDAGSVHPDSAPPMASASIGALLSEGRLRYVPGTRIDPGELSTGAGFSVIGDAELAGAAVGGRTVDRLRFAELHPNARLTEPGDVVFSSGPVPRALVDDEGSAVVAYPARVLRIDRADSAGVLPELLAADIRTARSREWRRWILRRVRQQQREPLQLALASIRTARADAEQRVAQLTELEHLVTDAVTSGAVSLTKGTD